MQGMIPALGCIDFEPSFGPPGSAPEWDGFPELFEFVERVRPRLSDRSGQPVNLNWFVTIDPMVEACFGDPGDGITRHRDIIETLLGHGDRIGIHVHAHRWDATAEVWYSDYGDVDWAVHCMHVALETFAQHFGAPPRCVREGGYFMPERVIDTEVSGGVEVNLTVEPGLPGRSTDPSFGEYATGSSTDFQRFPNTPYFPSRHDAGEIATDTRDARPILMVPLTSYDWRSRLMPWHRRVARRMLGRPPIAHLPLSPWRAWPSPQFYWDMVTRAAEQLRHPYFAFSHRNMPSHTTFARRFEELFEHLAVHPIGRRLHFVDALAPEVRALATEPAPVS